MGEPSHVPWTFEELIHADFERLLLAHLLHSEAFLARCRGLIEPRYFAKTDYRTIYTELRTFYEQYQQMPTMDSARIAAASTVEGAALKANFDAVFADLARISPEEIQSGYLGDRIVGFAQRIAAAEAVQEAGQDLKGFEIGEHHLEFARILQLPSLFADLGFSIRRHWKLMVTPEDIPHFPTGWATFDTAMRRGLRPGELCCILAPLKKGKSTALMNIGAQFMKMGYRVVHITLEMYTRDVLARYCSILTNTPTMALKEAPSRLSEFMDTLPHYVPDTADVVVKEFPARTCTVEMLEGYLAQLQADTPPDAYGQPIPIIPIVDYGDLLLGPQVEEWKELAEIYTQLRNLAQKLHVPIITASQTNAGGFQATELGAQHQSGSTRKGFVVDYMWALNQSNYDYQLSRFTLVPILNRNARKDAITYWRANYESGLMLELSQEQFDKLDPNPLQKLSLKQRAEAIRTAISSAFGEGASSTLAMLEKLCLEHLRAVETEGKKKG